MSPEPNNHNKPQIATIISGQMKYGVKLNELAAPSAADSAMRGIDPDIAEICMLALRGRPIFEAAVRTATPEAQFFLIRNLTRAA